MTGSPLLRRLAPILLVIAMSATACSAGSDGGPTVLGSRSATPGPGSPAPTASLTTAQIAAQAEATVRGYYAELNRAFGTGDTTTLREITKQSCACRRIVATIEEAWRSGSLRGDNFFVPKSFDPHDVFESVASVRVVFDGGAYEVLDKEGRVRDRAPAVTGQVDDVEVVREEGQWVVSDVRILR